MHKSLLQTGQCVFCEIRQLCRANIQHTRQRGYVRKVSSPQERGSSRERRNGIEELGKAGRRVDIKARFQDRQDLTSDLSLGRKRDVYNQGWVSLSKLGKDKKADRKGQDPFKEAVYDQLDEIQGRLHKWEALAHLKLSEDELRTTFSAFRDDLLKAIEATNARQKLTSKTRAEQDEGFKTVHNLLEAYKYGTATMQTTLKHAYYGYVARSRYSTVDLREQRNLADLRYPLEWYPQTRSIRRKIHLHVGPTNSGKTYHALKALEAAKKGLYAGPLRLLAHEVYTRLNAAGRRCQLLTGEERRYPDEDPYVDLVSCTVEMVDCSGKMDVAVIDEIQMIGSQDRGWAWTQAFLGVMAKEVHLCGEERTVPLIKELTAMIGDSLEIHRYERLSPLKMDAHHLHGKLTSLRKGDCVVCFSVLGIHSLRRSIEKLTNKKVAIVYGGLPPEVRAQQARLFNDPDNDYDILVASDAVGMGLNLSIKRIVFETSQKNDGSSLRTLKVSEVKQIGGRAGRYRSAHQAVKLANSLLDASAPEVEPSTEVVIEHPEDSKSKRKKLKQTVVEPRGESSSSALLSSDAIEDMATENTEQVPSEEIKDQSTGLVTTLFPFDFPIIKRSMDLEPEPIRTAGLAPPAKIIERFTSYFPPGTPFSYILLRLNEISQVNDRFHMCGLRDSMAIADAIHSVENLPTLERIAICNAPVSLTQHGEMKKLIQVLAGAIANQRGGGLLEIPTDALQLELLDVPVSGSRKYLSDMEILHKMIIVYLWLSYRFSGVFYTRQLAFYVKELIEKRIEQALSMFNFSETARRKIVEAREKNLLKEMEESLSADQTSDDLAEAAKVEESPESAARSDDETAETFDEIPVSEEASENENPPSMDGSPDNFELDLPDAHVSKDEPVKGSSVA